MTKEEYQIKIAKLRKKRNFHEEEARKYAQLMNSLQIDKKYNDVLKGEYVIIDYSPGGYKKYFHINKWEKTPRGAMFYGKGFFDTLYGLQISAREQIIYENKGDIVYSITIITKEEYDKAFEEAIETLKKKFYE